MGRVNMVHAFRFSPVFVVPQVFTAVAGLTSDANILINYARLAAQRYRCVRLRAIERSLYKRGYYVAL